MALAALICSPLPMYVGVVTYFITMFLAAGGQCLRLLEKNLTSEVVQEPLPLKQKIALCATRRFTKTVPWTENPGKPRRSAFFLTVCKPWLEFLVRRAMPAPHLCPPKHHGISPCVLVAGLGMTLAMLLLPVTYFAINMFVLLMNWAVKWCVVGKYTEVFIVGRRSICVEARPLFLVCCMPTLQ